MVEPCSPTPSAAGTPATFGTVLVSDLRHFQGAPLLESGPALRLANHLMAVARAASAGDRGPAWVSALPCRRRPGRKPCPGTIAIARIDVPASVHWRCTACHDEGLLRGWEQGPFDLRPVPGTERVTTPEGEAPEQPGGSRQVVLSVDAAAALRTMEELDVRAERLVYRARPLGDAVLVEGGDEELGQLLEHVAAEATHEENRRRRKRLDALYEELEAQVG